MSEKGIELTEESWQKAVLWFDIETLAADGSYKPEDHYRATINGKALSDFRDMTPEQLVAYREFLTTQALKEQLQHEEF